ncbi:MAG: hypothetical protein QXM16_03675 [Nitrososphaerota archaeon]
MANHLRCTILFYPSRPDSFWDRVPVQGGLQVLLAMHEEYEKAGAADVRVRAIEAQPKTPITLYIASLSRRAERG